MRRVGLVVLLALSGCTATFQTDAALGYPCALDAGDAQCPGGWMCTRDGRCVDPSEGAAVSCLADAECPGQWRCGLDGRCLNPDLGASVRCLSPSDCPGGWKCSLTNVCVDPALGADLACRSDDDCTGGFRCGLSGRCFDAGGELLRPAPEAVLSLVSPTWGEKGGLLAMDVHPRDEGTTLALLREDSATWVRLLWRDSPKVVSRTEVPLTGLPAGAFSAGLWRDEVVVAGSTELRALPLDGGAARIVASYPASVDETAFGLAVRGDGVLVAAVVRGSKADGLIAFLSPDGGVQTRPTTLMGNKVAWTRGLACGALGVLVACQNDGTCTFETDNLDAGNVGGPEQVFPPSLVGLKLGRLLGRRDQVYAEARPSLGAPVSVEPTLEIRGSMLGFQVACDLGKSSLTSTPATAPGFCASGLLADAWPTPGQPEAYVCQDARQRWSTSQGWGNDAPAQVPQAPLQVSAWLSSAGQVWHGEGSGLTSHLLWEPPHAVVRYLDTEVLETATAAWKAEPGVGLAQHRPLVRTLGTFDDRPDWALLPDSTVVQVTHSANTTKPVLAALDPLLSNQETTPALLRLAGATLVAGIRDAVWTSTGSLDGGQALLSPRVRPAAGFDLDVLTVRETGDGGVASFTGYAVANQKLFRLDAPRASVVRAVEVQLEEPVAFVWYQGDAARVLSSSGRVRTLPGGALVQAAELSGELAAVGALCGTAYLLLDPVVAGAEKTAPLLRLVPGADGRGIWAKVELPDGERLEAGEALGARMQRAGDTLWLTSKHGVTWRLDAPDGGCR